ncbi:unnamed protein product [Arctia plantaginis]|uniref:Uncharacterized protein n=1 Tax=Arctia plantaginis TaxID=874455 RepID=A0A8S1AZN2_ARCPL|nr:unnamed protein product [Arctia plantaginis]
MWRVAGSPRGLSMGGVRGAAAASSHSFSRRAAPGRRRRRATPPEDKFGANGNWRRWAPVINVRRGNREVLRYYKYQRKIK